MTLFGMGGGNRVHVEVTGSDAGLRKVLKAADAKVDSFGKGISSTLKKHADLIKTAFAVGAARAVVGFVADATKAASDLRESQNAVNVVFGESAGLILGFGQVAAEQAGLSSRAFNEMGANIGAILGNMLDDERLVASETINLAKRAADMASVMNTDVADAMNAIRSGLSGQVMPLRRYGVDLTVTAVKLKAVELGLADSTTEVGKQEKALARLALIFEQTDKFAGDFLNTIDEVANVQRVMEAKTEDNAAAIGEKLIPALALWQDVQINVLDGANRLIGIFNEEVEGANKLNAAFRHLSEGTGETADSQERLAEVLIWAGEHMGITADTLELLAGASGLTAKELQNAHIQALNLGRAAGLAGRDLERLEEAVVRNLQAAGLTDDAYQQWIVTLGRSDAALRVIDAAVGDLTSSSGELTFALNATRIEMSRNTREAAAAGRAASEAAEDERELAAAMDEVKAAAARQQTALLNIHNPLFRMVDLVEDLAEAEQAVLDADHEIEAHGATATDFSDLWRDRANVLGELMGTLTRLREDGINPTGEAARSMLREGLSIPDSVIDEIFATFDRIEANLDARTFAIRLETFSREVGRDPLLNQEARAFGSDPRLRSTNPQEGLFQFHTGGRVNAPTGQEVSARLVGGEVVSNPVHGGSGGSGGLTIEQHFHRVEGEDTDLARTAALGVSLSGISRIIEQRRVR